MKTLMTASLIAISISTLAAQPTRAASLLICDAAACGSPDPNIKFSADDFELGFSVNGVQIQSGLDSPGSAVVNEAGSGPSSVDGAAIIDFTGDYMADSVTEVGETVFFTEGNGPAISDVLSTRFLQGRGVVEIQGSVISDVNETTGLSVADLNAAGFFADQTVSEDSPFTFNNVNLTATFQSDVPEPSTWAMMLVGFAGLGFAAYRRGAKPRLADLTA